MEYQADSNGSGLDALPELTHDVWLSELDRLRVKDVAPPLMTDDQFNAVHYARTGKMPPVEWKKLHTWYCQRFESVGINTFQSRYRSEKARRGIE